MRPKFKETVFMNELIGKRLLVLGGGLAAYDVVKKAKENGAYVVSAD